MRVLAEGRRSWNRQCQGTAATELAIVLPVMLLLTFAGSDFGRALHEFIALSNAVRVGAEYGTRHPYSPVARADWEARVRNAVREELANTPAIEPDRLVINVATTEDEGSLFHLTVEAEYLFTTIVDWPGIPHQVQLFHRVAMRRQR
jgi:Flp pilus assembly protein TadG